MIGEFFLPNLEQFGLCTPEILLAFAPPPSPFDKPYSEKLAKSSMTQPVIGRLCSNLICWCIVGRRGGRGIVIIHFRSNPRRSIYMSLKSHITEESKDKTGIDLCRVPHCGLHHVRLSVCQSRTSL